MSSPQGKEWIIRYASALGVAADDIEEFESESDPRPDNPKREPADTDAELEAIKAVLSKAEADVTAGELKELALRAFRRMHRHGALR